MSSRADDAARIRRELAARPGDAVGWHNLAAAEGDIGRAAESEQAARKAIALGLGAPETRLVLARALQSLGRLDEAERWFEAALELRPSYADAHRDYAQLVWMRTGEAARATRRLDEAVAAAPDDAALHLVRSIVLDNLGRRDDALAAALAGLEQSPENGDLRRQAAHLLGETGEIGRAIDVARAAAAATGEARAQIALCEALIAGGGLAEAEGIALSLRALLPTNQYVVALVATIWRLAGNPRYAELHDYARLVSVRRLDPPSGWASIDAFMADIATELDALHQFVAPPLQQSVRGGGQLTFQEHHLARPLIRALFQTLGDAVQDHLRRIGPGPDPLRARNKGRGVFSGAWSVRLASGGSHVDHVHPQGWLSSACYVALPPTIGAGEARDGRGVADRSGWLRFGRPGIRVPRPLEADHHIRPEAGRLALFPAYMWHGVEPFAGDRPRLSVAFDVVPG